ncbi:pseudouridine synthase [Catenuloplanes sp. NPDC051500]|uniref:pseudouridine synthase n=1 Tax=Catenuloplanes sp. NPDC051500 TaxID=3363959 RepID=UPI00378E9CC1
MPENDGAERLQKIMAAAGVGSRRACETLIIRGKVTVDGRLAQVGDRANPATSVIMVNGERIVSDTTLVYIAMNKPRDVISTMADEKGRTAISDFLGRVEQRVYHVGRLDQDSEGLLLLTNDGTLAHKLTHPSYGVQKTYLCEVAGPLPRAVGRRLLSGVELEDGPVKVDTFKLVDTLGKTAQIEITLHEGRKHIVRRLMDEVGHPVSRLIRTQIGPIKLGDLRTGRTRRLNAGEIASLFAAVED